MIWGLSFPFLLITGKWYLKIIPRDFAIPFVLILMLGIGFLFSRVYFRQRGIAVIEKEFERLKSINFERSRKEKLKYALFMTTLFAFLPVWVIGVLWVFAPYISS